MQHSTRSLQISRAKKYWVLVHRVHHLNQTSHFVSWWVKRTSLQVCLKKSKTWLSWQLLSCKPRVFRSEEHTSELQSRENLVCRLLLEKKKNTNDHTHK